MVQEARLSVAQAELSKAQSALDEKEKELAAVREKFDQAMKEKQVRLCYCNLSQYSKNLQLGN